MQLLHNANKKRIHTLATDFFACSEDAGKWMFDKDFTVVYNAIDLYAFSYDVQKGKKLRAELGIGDLNLVLVMLVGSLHRKIMRF